MVVGMANKGDRHLGDETAERYAVGHLSANAAAPVEEHLLICERCRQKLAAADAYSAVMRKAAAKLRKAARKPKRKGVNRARG